MRKYTILLFVFFALPSFGAITRKQTIHCSQLDSTVFDCQAPTAFNLAAHDTVIIWVYNATGNYTVGGTCGGLTWSPVAISGAGGMTAFSVVDIPVAIPNCLLDVSRASG